MNTSEALPTATQTVRYTISILALLVGLVALAAEMMIAGPIVPAAVVNQAGNKPRQAPVTQIAILIALGVTYVVRRALYWRMGIASRYLGNWLKTGIAFVLLLFVAVGISQGWHTLRTTGVVRPCFPLGLLLTGVALRDFWRHVRFVILLQRTDPGYATGRDQGDEEQTARPLQPPAPSYSASLAGLMSLARYNASYYGQEFVGTQHLLLACADLDTGSAGPALTAAGATVDRLLTALAPHLEREMIKLPKGELPLTPAVRRAVEQAEAAAKALGSEGATPEQLLLVLLSDPESVAVEALVGMGVDPKRVSDSLRANMSSLRDV